MTRFSTVPAPRGESPEPPARPSVRSIARALRVLRIMAAPERSEWSLFELCQAANLPKATVHRLLGTMIEEGFVEHARNPGYYRLGLEAAIVGHASLERRKPEASVDRILTDLVRRVQETVSVGLLSGTSMLSIARTHPSGTRHADVARGAVLPAHVSSGGKMLLASLPPERVAELYRGRHALQRFTPKTIATVPELMRHLAIVRERGYGIDDEEYVTGVRCLTVPIPSAAGPSHYCVGLSAPTARATLTQLRIAVRILDVAAVQLAPYFVNGAAPAPD
ncbi:IclR family transcriptional regulator [Conexibacter woesei]|uniref:Glycerol operon regulatory protein n=1 Tax=Conexibacter woesei (strain DSM 14684 / CCUG 47730 / CIP 108061 / JCM 11494 / NBRC 100937 / ID131577) TaxID=469383 RepID=D3FAR5_CONWI|nr:IclR family transcriptional regulator [Conexibacter woesei]ADB51228.1 transcriptional regulator, IclR family [Conexibacter woesei DSM 14684]